MRVAVIVVVGMMALRIKIRMESREGKLKVYARTSRQEVKGRG